MCCAVSRGAACHLQPGGLLCFDVRNFLCEAEPSSPVYRPVVPIALPSLGTSLHYAEGELVTMLESEQRYQIRFSIGLGTPQEQLTTVTATFWQRWFYPEELLTLLSQAGLRAVQLCGDFDSSPFTRRSPELIVAAVVEGGG